LLSERPELVTVCDDDGCHAATGCVMDRVCFKDTVAKLCSQRSQAASSDTSLVLLSCGQCQSHCQQPSDVLQAESWVVQYCQSRLSQLG
jgi:hypothetical protein